MKRLAPPLLVVVALLSPSAALAASEGASGMLWEFLNLFLLGAVIFFAARKPVSAYLAQRRSGIEEDIASAERLLQDAESRLSEWTAKTEQLDADVSQIRQLTRDRAERERERILEEAERAAERIRRDAESAVDRELDRARTALREEAADLAVELAERMLSEQVTDDDRARLVDEFVQRIEAAPAGGNA